jgi:division protein CdvB (Snf7/Vps24/ESCRT-III family)
MGFLKNMAGWLSGGRSKDKDVRSVTVKLKIFNKRLERQARKLDQKAKQARTKAVNLRREGDMKGSEVQARGYLQFKKWSKGIETFRLNLEGLQFKLEQATAIRDVTGIVSSIATSVTGLKAQISIPELTETIKDIDLAIEDFQVTEEIASDGIENITVDTAVSNEEVKNTLSEIDAEISVETGISLPTVAEGDQRITDLEKELKELKESED